MKNLSLLAVFLTALLFSLTATASIYKWVDDNGRVQYTQTPPMDRPSEEIKGVKGSSQPVAPTRKPVEDSSDKKVMKSESEQGTRIEVVDEKELASYCNDLRESYRVLQEHNRASVMEDGKVRAMPYEEKKKNMDEIQQKIDQYCK